MSAMRDASVEFGGRSRFWGSLLKTIEVDDDIAADLEQRFAALNTELLGADPKLDSIKTTLRAISRVIANRSEEHTSELQSLMRNTYAVFCLKKKNNNKHNTQN